MDVLISGCDVSAYNGVLSATHWKALAHSHKFVIIKCGNGNDKPDPNYLSNLHAARGAGLIVGTYHFVYVLPDDPGHPGRSPEEQAAAHYAHASYMSGDLLPWADVEFPSHTQWDHWKLPKGAQKRADFIADFIVRYVGQYAKLSGLPMGFYSYSWWVKAAGLENSARRDVLTSMPFWQADTPVPRMPSSLPGGAGPWRHADVFQWTNSLRAPNGTRLDGNVCHPSTLKRLTVSSSALARSFASAAELTRQFAGKDLPPDITVMRI